jgi:hypothetical protein
MVYALPIKQGGLCKWDQVSRKRLESDELLLRENRAGKGGK